MQYFDPEFFNFFFELSENNHRDWFNENRKRYKEFVKDPLYRFTDDLILAIKEHEPELECQAKHCVFRINRDIRFAKDKTPYNLHVSAIISAKGRKNHAYPGFYFQFGLKGSYFGSGAYGLDKDQLLSFRRSILTNPKRFNSLIHDKKVVKMFGPLQGEKNKRIPKEFVEVGNTYPEIYNKQYYFMAESKENDWALRPDLIDFAMKHYKQLNDFNHYIKETIF